MRVEGADAAGAQPHLGRRLLARDVEHRAGRRGEPAPRPRAAAWTCRRRARPRAARPPGDQPAAEHAVELVDARSAGPARPRPRRRGCAARARSPGRRPRARGRLQRGAGRVDGAPGLALAAPADPLRGLPAALGAAGRPPARCRSSPCPQARAERPTGPGRHAHRELAPAAGPGLRVRRVRCDDRRAGQVRLAEPDELVVRRPAHQLDQLRTVGDVDRLAADVRLGVARAVPVQVVAARRPSRAGRTRRS